MPLGMPSERVNSLIEWLWPALAGVGWAVAFVAFYSGGFTTRMAALEDNVGDMAKRVDKLGETDIVIVREIQALRAEREAAFNKFNEKIVSNTTRLDAENRWETEQTAYLNKLDAKLSDIINRISANILKDPPDPKRRQ